MTAPGTRSCDRTAAACWAADRQVYLDGSYGSEESCKSYTEVLRQWQEHDHHPLVSHDELAVTELLARYLEYARRYYRKDDKPTSEVATLRSVIHVLNEAYGDIPVVSFGPLKLERYATA